MNIDYAFFKRFMAVLGEFLGDGCEVVVHDYRNGFDHTIVDIVNGRLSNRRVGDSPRGAHIVGFGKCLADFEYEHVYYFTGHNGRLFKSCSIFITGEDDRIEGEVCVNIDVTDLMLGQAAVQKLVGTRPSSSGDLGEKGLVARNVDEVLQYYFNTAQDLVGKPMVLMNKDEKIKALEFLDNKGVFKISKAAVMLCELFQVSKYTLYSYLDEARKGREALAKTEPERILTP